MSSVITPRECRAAYSSSPKSSPTGPTTRVSAKNEEASEKCTAEPPSSRSRFPVSVSTASNAMDPTTVSDIAVEDGSVPTMRAVVITEFGGPEALQLVEDHPQPEPAEGQVLVKVSRAGINFADTHARENSYLSSYELPLIPGGEVAGEVDGKRVVALTGTGGYAEYAVAPEAAVFPLPDGVSDTAALAIIIQGLSAWHLLRTSARMAEGESVVVHAAAGGVGSLAVQLAKRYGAGRVIATAVDRGEARAGARARRRRRGRPQRGGPQGRAARGQRRRQGRHRARDGGRARVRPVAARAGAVRPPRHLRPGVARVQPGEQRRADGPQPGRHRLLARALLQPPAGDDRRAAGGAVRPRRVRRAAGDRGRRVRALGGPPRPRGHAGAGRRAASCRSIRRGSAARTSTAAGQGSGSKPPPATSVSSTARMRGPRRHSCRRQPAPVGTSLPSRS